ncbi:MAG: protease complex subunit PrcB family protein [Lachnospiraceae bacterium]|nr:protease complex subunit PrcB family protein [Lachnospiraceae bacterium]
MRRFFCFVLTLMMVLGLVGCDMGIKIGDANQGAGDKVRDLEYTILSEERMPKELVSLLEERQEEPFEMTYSDKEYLYICIGYGRQEYSGHSIVVNGLFLGENGILVDTSLIGPEAGKEKINTVQFPIIVLKTELIEDVPLFAK